MGEWNSCLCRKDSEKSGKDTATMLGRANLLLSRGGLNGLAAFSVAGRNAVASQVTSFVTETPFSAFSLNKEASSVQKNVTRGFAAEAEPVAAAGKGAITQVGLLFFFFKQAERTTKKERKETQEMGLSSQAPERKKRATCAQAGTIEGE